MHNHKSLRYSYERRGNCSNVFLYPTFDGLSPNANVNSGSQPLKFPGIELSPLMKSQLTCGMPANKNRSNASFFHYKTNQALEIMITY